jgi:hypothetical protein
MNVRLAPELRGDPKQEWRPRGRPGRAGAGGRAGREGYRLAGRNGGRPGVGRAHLGRRGHHRPHPGAFARVGRRTSGHRVRDGGPRPRPGGWRRWGRAGPGGRLASLRDRGFLADRGLGNRGGRRGVGGSLARPGWGPTRFRTVGRGGTEDLGLLGVGGRRPGGRSRIDRLGGGRGDGPVGHAFSRQMECHGEGHRVGHSPGQPGAGVGGVNLGRPGTAGEREPRGTGQLGDPRGLDRIPSQPREEARQPGRAGRVDRHVIPFRWERHLTLRRRRGRGPGLRARCQETLATPGRPGAPGRPDPECQ